MIWEEFDYQLIYSIICFGWRAKPVVEIFGAVCSNLELSWVKVSHGPEFPSNFKLFLISFFFFTLQSPPGERRRKKNMSTAPTSIFHNPHTEEKENMSHITIQLHLPSKAKKYWGCPKISTAQRLERFILWEGWRTGERE